MCLTPIAIRNPNRKIKQGSFSINNSELYNKIKDNESAYMYVPCGHCKQCIALAQMELVERVQMEAIYNHIFMGTLTYKNETLPRLETPNWEDQYGREHEGYEYRYAKYEDAAAAVRRMRDRNVFDVPFKYLIITERGSKRARPHFHWLLLFRKEDIGKTYNDCLHFEEKYKWTLLENWQRNIGSQHYPIYQDLCEYHESWRGKRKRATYDFHYVNPLLTKGGVTDAAFYVLKYMLKGIQDRRTMQAIFLNYDNATAWNIWNRIRNRREYSLGFGLDVDWSKKGKDRKITEEICNSEIIEYLAQGVKRSKAAREEYAYYYCPENLLTFPLANYYKRFSFIYSAEDEIDFYNICPDRYRKHRLMPERPDGHAIKKQIGDFERILKQTEMLDIADDFDSLF